MPAPDPETYFAATSITGVDTWMAGRARVTSAYLLHGSQPVLVETGPTTSVEAVTAGLNSLGLRTRGSPSGRTEQTGEQRHPSVWGGTTPRALRPGRCRAPGTASGCLRRRQDRAGRA